MHDEIERRIETAQNHSADRLREKQLLGERERLTKQHCRLLDAYQESLVEELDELCSRALDARLEELASATKDKEYYLAVAETVEAIIDRVKRFDNTKDIDEWRKILGLLVKEILVDDDTITIRHIIPISRGTQNPIKHDNFDTPDQNCKLRFSCQEV